MDASFACACVIFLPCVFDGSPFCIPVRQTACYAFVFRHLMLSCGFCVLSGGVVVWTEGQLFHIGSGAVFALGSFGSTKNWRRGRHRVSYLGISCYVRPEITLPVVSAPSFGSGAASFSNFEQEVKSRRHVTHSGRRSGPQH